jgi:ecotin
MKRLILIIALAAVSAISNLKAQNKTPKYEKLEIEMFPRPKIGYKQLYIQVPVEKNEEDFKVEFFVGKNEEVDCNSYSLNAFIKEENLNGWGYNYYSVESNGVVLGTLMHCIDNKKTIKFISTQPQLVRYNSKLPIVVYVPENLELKYRIWKADKTLQNATIKKN